MTTVSKIASSTILALFSVCLSAHTSKAQASTYAYDELNRLIYAEYNNGESVVYTYDPAGNLLSTIVSAASQDFDSDGTPDIHDPDDDNDNASDDSEAGNLTNPLDDAEWPQPFADVVNTDYAYAISLALADNHVAIGCGDDNFCTNDVIDHTTAVTWLLKASNAHPYTPPGADGADFTDVDTNTYNADYIEEALLQSITDGCDTDLFCPGQGVTKTLASMLILRTLGYTNEPVPSSLVWDDIELDTPGAGWAEEMGNLGYDDGCGSNNFCPNEVLTRTGFGELLSNAFGW